MTSKLIKIDKTETPEARRRQALAMLAGATGSQSEFLQTVVQALSLGLDCMLAAVGEINEDKSKVRMLVVFKEGKFSEPYTYDLAGTPCEGIYTSTDVEPHIHHYEGLCALFPTDHALARMGAESYRAEAFHDVKGNRIGHVFVIQNTRTYDSEDDIAFFRLISQRIGAEYNRWHAETDRVKIEKHLHDSEANLRSILDNSPAAIYLKDIEGRFIEANRQYEIYYGVKSKDIIGKTSRQIFQGEQGKKYFKDDMAVVSSQDALVQEEQLGEESFVTSKFPILDDDGVLIGLAGIEIDITERKRAENKFQQLAFTDVSTGMPNEAAFLEKLHESIDQDQQGFVASIELSGLGDIIGTFGLEALELIVYELGKRLTSQMNDLSIAARVGQRSFRVVYITDDIDEQALKDIAARIFQIAQQAFDLMGSGVFVNVYMAVSIIDVEKSTTNTILTDIEIAHYEALKSVSSSIVYFENSIKESLVRSTQIVSWLHSDIDNDVFKLFFQPQVNLKTNTIVGCEALIRWQRNPNEWITPGEFIPIAEKAGLIGDITRWTVAEACRKAAYWTTEQGLNIRVGVNISAEELASPCFLDYVSEYIEKTKLPPEFIEIEITETALMKDPDIAAKNLNMLRAMGASVAIDDFGTGQASLAYLKHFPIDRLKIDQSFVKGAPSNNTDREIIVSVIKLAHSLAIDVIAEGAEEKQHIDLLTSLGCDEVQGYYITKPMPVDQFVEFVHAYS